MNTLIILVTMVIMSLGNTAQNTVDVTMCVVECNTTDTQGYEIVVVDDTDNEFVYYSSTREEINTIKTLTINTQGTEEKCDDEIIDVK